MKPEVRALLIVLSLTAIPLYMGFYMLPCFFLLFIGGLIWEDAKKTKQVNPYIWKWSWQEMLNNRWFGFMLVYLIWLLPLIFRK